MGKTYLLIRSVNINTNSPMTTWTCNTTTWVSGTSWATPSNDYEISGLVYGDMANLDLFNNCHKLILMPEIDEGLDKYTNKKDPNHEVSCRVCRVCGEHIHPCGSLDTWKQHWEEKHRLEYDVLETQT